MQTGPPGLPRTGRPLHVRAAERCPALIEFAALPSVPNSPCDTSAPAAVRRYSTSRACSWPGSRRTAGSTFPSGGRPSPATSWSRSAAATTPTSPTRSSPGSPATPSINRSCARSSAPRTPSSGTPRWRRSRSSARTTGYSSSSTGRRSHSRTSPCRCWAGSTTISWSATTPAPRSSAPRRATPAPPPSRRSRAAIGPRSSSFIRQAASRRSSAGR